MLPHKIKAYVLDVIDAAPVKKHHPGCAAFFAGYAGMRYSGGWCKFFAFAGITFGAIMPVQLG